MQILQSYFRFECNICNNWKIMDRLLCKRGKKCNFLKKPFVLPVLSGFASNGNCFLWDTGWGKRRRSLPYSVLLFFWQAVKWFYDSFSLEMRNETNWNRSTFQTTDSTCDLTYPIFECTRNFPVFRESEAFHLLRQCASVCGDCVALT